MAYFLKLAIFAILNVLVHGSTTCDNVEGLKGCACQMNGGGPAVSLQELVGNNTDGNPIR